MKFNELLGFFITLLAVLNPLGSMMIFLSLTRQQTKPERQKTAVATSVAILLILLVVTWIGIYLLDFLGISTEAFKMGGALILLLFGLKLLGEQDRSKEEGMLGPKENIAVVPLAMPVIAGPAAIATVISFISTHKTFLDHIALSVISVVLTVILFILLFYAHSIAEFMGKEGVKVFNKIMGMILMAMGMQMFISGLRILLPGLTH